MKHIRILSLSLALVLMASLFAACGKSGSESGSASQPDVSVSMPEADVSAPGDVSQPEAETPAPEEKPVAPEAKPEQKPENKPEENPQAPAPGNDTPIEVKPEQKPEVPAPEVKPEENPEEPAPAGVDLEAFYQTIFTDPENSPALVPMDAGALDAFLPGLTAISTKQLVAYMPMMTAVPCEIVMVECASAADVETVKTIFNTRITAQVDNQFNYPMVIEAWETEARVVSNGNFVALLVISGMTDQVVASFNALF